jgi:1-phosphatidylinositol-4-phosphate 5-kinase
MKKILPSYHDYLTTENPDSLMSKVLGLHKVIFYRKKGKMSKKIYFAIMDNVFNTCRKIDYRYDLKGSSQGRETKLLPD